jgi:hypothetical protein
MPAFSSSTMVTSSLPIEQCKQLKEENKQLKLELQQLKDSNQMKLNLSDEIIPQSSSSTSNVPSSSSSSSTSVVDPNKLNQRLKEIFREKITTFRNAVYLLTGYHVREICFFSHSELWFLWLFAILRWNLLPLIQVVLNHYHELKQNQCLLKMLMIF